MRNLPSTVGRIAAVVGGAVEGDASAPIHAMAPVESAGANDLTFAADERRVAKLASSRAGCAIVGKLPGKAPMTLIRVADVNAAVAALLGHLADPEDLPSAGVHPTAVVAPTADLGDGVAVGPGVVIGERARIGPGCVLCARSFVGAGAVLGESTVLFEGVVVRSGSEIGRRVRIGPNSVIGWDGFGYYLAGGEHRKIPHAGNVVIEDDVEIGACACVDKAKFGSTRIGAGTKIDNLVQVAHNVQIGRGCILVGQCGVAGSARLGEYVVLGGGAGIRDNLTLGDGAQCGAHAAVLKDVPAGQTVAGLPAEPMFQKIRSYQALKRLPGLLKKVRELEARLSALESAKNH